MHNVILLPLSQALSAQASSSPLNSTALICLTLAALGGIAAYLASAKVKKLQREALDLNTTIENKSSELKQSNSANKKLQSNMDEKNSKIQKLKKDLANQRKKTHSAQEEFKELRVSTNEKLAKMEKEYTNKPAFKPSQIQLPTKHLRPPATPLPNNPRPKNRQRPSTNRT